MIPIRKRFTWALVAYAAIGLAAWFTLDGQFRLIVLILLGVFAVKSWIAVRREELD
ncbi:MAG: hypothetical protein QM757_24525 [Paludibaculum sp.]